MYKPYPFLAVTSLNLSFMQSRKDHVGTVEAMYSMPTQTHTHTHAYQWSTQDQFYETRHTPACGRCTFGLKILPRLGNFLYDYFYWDVIMLLYTHDKNPVISVLIVHAQQFLWSQLMLYCENGKVFDHLKSHMNHVGTFFV